MSDEVAKSDWLILNPYVFCGVGPSSCDVFFFMLSSGVDFEFENRPCFRRSANLVSIHFSTTDGDGGMCTGVRIISFLDEE